MSNEEASSLEGRRWEVAEVGSSGILSFDMALPRYSQSLFVTSNREPLLDIGHRVVLVLREVTQEK